MVALGFDQTAVKCRQIRIIGLERFSEQLKFLATPALDEAATDQVVNDLMALAVAKRAHQPADPRAGMGLPERNPATAEQLEDEFKMLKLLDGDSVQFM